MPDAGTFVAAVDASKKVLKGMGINNFGQLGNLTFGPYNTVIDPGVNNTISKLYTSFHVLMVMSDGKLFALGMKKVFLYKFKAIIPMDKLDLQ